MQLILPLALISFLVVFTKENALAAGRLSKNHLHHVTVYMHVVTSVTKSGNHITPNGTTNGNCGTIEFYVDDDGNGDASFWMLVSSNYGKMNSLTYHWAWQNFSTGGGYSYGQKTLINVSSPWSQNPIVLTEAGYVTGSIVASDYTGGKTCAGSESDGNTITGSQT